MKLGIIKYFQTNISCRTWLKSCDIQPNIYAFYFFGLNSSKLWASFSWNLIKFVSNIHISRIYCIKLKRRGINKTRQIILMYSIGRHLAWSEQLVEKKYKVNCNIWSFCTSIFEILKTSQLFVWLKGCFRLWLILILVSYLNWCCYCSIIPQWCICL